MLNPDINLLAYGTDSYKVGHWPFYHPGTTFMFSYGEGRSGGMFPKISFSGLQYVLSHLAGEFATTEKIDEAEKIADEHIGPGVFNRVGWERIRDNHNGRLPLRIKALPEGTEADESNVLFTIECTDHTEAWLVNWVETMISHVWYPTTVMTAAREILKLINAFLVITGTPEGLPFKLHDFGYRGVSCTEQAGIGGGAVLAAGSMGTDNMMALYFVKKYYDAQEMPAFSIRATEHSIMTLRGIEGEADVVRQVLDNTPNDQMVAMVGDSYDMIGFVEKILATPDIKERIVARTAPLIVRPDSGELPQIDIDVFRSLEKVFGSSENGKGYVVLPHYIRMIQGDGIKWYRDTDGKPRHTVGDILGAFMDVGISADNIAFGSGGGLLQQFDRDTQRFAVKCSYTERDGECFDVFKRPATDPTKNSKRGRLAVIRDKDGVIVTVPEGSLEKDSDNLLRDVFYDGVQMNLMTLQEVRDNTAL